MAVSGVVFSDTFDPSQETWSHSAAQGVDDWALSIASSHSPSHSYFSQDVSTVKDAYLLTRAIILPANAQLTFWHTYQLESGGDGAVLEISSNGGASFTDLSPRITAGGYTGQIATGYGSPISGRSAWTGGALGAMTQVVVDLSPFVGQSVILRFRLTSDNGVGGIGWLIDDISVAGTSSLNTAGVTVSDAPHLIEFDWRAATTVGANDGVLTFWLDGTQQAAVTGIDNDTRRIDRVRLGAVGGN
jgi:hypothetical protein